ncbi:ER membrane protein complex subunit 8/9 [Pelomyxa schiedti]|nr:ER membrane protein complex subunit 8/9 [Pelomyxa schiedti]
MSGATVSVEPRSYARAMAHAYKHPRDVIVGACLGARSSKKGAVAVSVVDVVPLFHGRVLAPFLEMALNLVEKYGAEKELVIVGVYYATSPERDRGVPPAPVEEIARKISIANGFSCIIRIDNTRASRDPPEFAMQILPSDQVTFNQDTAPLIQHLTHLMHSHSNTTVGDTPGLCTKLFDFDDFLNNPSSDWLDTSSIFSHGKST